MINGILFQETVACLMAAAGENLKLIDVHLVRVVIETVARVNKILSRFQHQADPSTQTLFSYGDYGDLMINLDARKVTKNGKEIPLAKIEFHLLKGLVIHAGAIQTDEDLLHKVWGMAYGREHDFVRVVVSHLRKKIETDPQNPKHIHTCQCGLSIPGKY